MHPSVCPLCRRPFLPDRSKKLITGDGESAEDMEALGLLQRLVISWDTETSDEERISLVTEVEGYLGGGNTVSGVLLVSILKCGLNATLACTFSKSPRSDTGIPRAQGGAT